MIYYPPLREKDVVAAMGYLYRVSDLNPPLEGIAMKLISDKEAPARLSVEWDSLIVPMRTGYEDKAEKSGQVGRTQFQWHFLLLDKVEVPKAKDTNPKDIVAHARICEWGENVEKGIPVKLKPGDYLVLRQMGHKVRKIVPPDVKTQVIGWLELEMRPIPEADLIKNKIPFIRPEKK